MASDIAFQPIVSLTDRSVIGHEALLRPRNDVTAGAPSRVFERAARLGVSAEVETAAFRLATERFAAMRRPSHELLFCNFSGFSFAQTKAPDDVPRPICVEVSEKQRFDLVTFSAWLARWPSRPLVALDDFGTGWNGLAMMRSLRPDFVKIDRMFIAGLDRASPAAAFLGEIVRFVHAIGCRVIGEGIETEAEHAACIGAGCDYGQGYFYAPPALRHRDGSVVT